MDISSSSQSSIAALKNVLADGRLTSSPPLPPTTHPRYRQVDTSHKGRTVQPRAFLVYSMGRGAEPEFLNISWGRKTGVDLSLPPFFSMYIKCHIFEHTKKGGSWRSSQLWWRHKNLSSEIWGIPKIYSLLPPFSPPSSHMLSVQTNRNKGAIWENQLQLLSPHTILMFTNAKKGGRVR